MYLNNKCAISLVNHLLCHRPQSFTVLCHPRILLRESYPPCFSRGRQPTRELWCVRLLHDFSLYIVSFFLILRHQPRRIFTSAPAFRSLITTARSLRSRQRRRRHRPHHLQPLLPPPPRRQRRRPSRRATRHLPRTPRPVTTTPPMTRTWQGRRVLTSCGPRESTCRRSRRLQHPPPLTPE